MASSTFFLPQERRQREFGAVCTRAATAKHMIEALGIPHTEVTIVLVNGERCGFNKMLREGDVGSVYPALTGLGDDGLQTQTPLPTGRARFIADAHLGGLARRLRMAGFDTLYDNRYDDSNIAAIAARELRIVLTRDRDLLKRRIVAHGSYVRALEAPGQFGKIVQRLRLQAQVRPFTLCLHFNEPLRAVDKERVEQRLLPAVRSGQSEFRTCPRCGGLFWKGSHWKRMCEVLALAQCTAEAEGHLADGTP